MDDSCTAERRGEPCVRPSDRRGRTQGSPLPNKKTSSRLRRGLKVRLVAALLISPALSDIVGRQVGVSTGLRSTRFAAYPARLLWRHRAQPSTTLDKNQRVFSCPGRIVWGVPNLSRNYCGAGFSALFRDEAWSLH